MPSPLKDLIENSKKGDQSAFRILVETHQQYAFSLAFRILCNEDDARDAVQDSFIKVWKNINTYNVKMKFSTWLYKIVTNTAIDKLRSIGRTTQVSYEDAIELADHSTIQDADKQFENKELGQLIQLISDGLPEKQRLVFVMRDLQGMEAREVIQILDQTEDQVKSNLYHARKSIREKLNRIIKYERRQK